MTRALVFSLMLLAASAQAAPRLVSFHGDAKGYTYVVEDQTLSRLIVSRAMECSQYASSQRALAQVLRGSSMDQMQKVGPAFLRDAQRRYDACQQADLTMKAELKEVAELLNVHEPRRLQATNSGIFVQLFLPRGGKAAAGDLALR